MKTKVVDAEDVAGGDKIVLDGVVFEVYDADSDVGRYDDVRIELSNGEVLTYGCFDEVILVEE